jgi:TRAP-type C4-dicarboxylate transport system substrate-binding protein
MTCRRLAGAVAVAIAAMVVFGGAPACAQLRWNLPSAYPTHIFHIENLQAFADELGQATGGQLVITVHPNASLFPASAIKSAVRIGRAQIGETLISLHDSEDPVFGIDVVPFLATSYRDARKLWAASKGLLERKLAVQGLLTLFTVPWPPQGIFSKKEIDHIADMKGLSWRVYNASTQRIAQIVEAYPVTIQAADLRDALATGLINAFMTSVATGLDVRAWESMTYFYNAQAWIPKNITFVNRAAFDQLDRPTQQRVLNAGAAAEERGWRWSEEKAKSHTEQLVLHGMKVLSPSPALRTGLQQIGEQLTREWIEKTGSEGQAIIDAYRRPAT